MTTHFIKDPEWHTHHPIGQLFSDYGVISHLRQIVEDKECDIPPGFEKSGVSQKKTYAEVTSKIYPPHQSFSFVPIMYVPDYTVVPFTRWKSVICERFYENMCLCITVVQKTNRNVTTTLGRLGFLTVKNSIATSVILRMSSTTKLLKHILSTPGLTFALYDKSDNGIGAIMNATLDDNLTKMQKWFRACRLFVIRSTWKRKQRSYEDLASYAKYSQGRYGDIASFTFHEKKEDIPAHMIVVLKFINFGMIEHMISYAMMKRRDMHMIARLCETVSEARQKATGEHISKDTPLTMPELSLGPFDTLNCFRLFSVTLDDVRNQLSTFMKNPDEKKEVLCLPPIVALMEVSPNKYLRLVHY